MKTKLARNLLIIFFLFFGTEKLACGTNNSVIITVGNHPITRLDLIKEIKFITILSNVDINEDNKEQIKDLAIQSLIKRSIKKIEIEKQEINRYNSVDLERQILTVAKNLGLEKKEELKFFLKQRNLEYKDLVKKFEIDLKWNTLIFKLYKDKVSLNTLEIENKINSELNKVKSGRSLLLSEIQINLLSEGLEATADKVFLKIKEDGFENAARSLSISGSSENGGDIGWIKENKLSKKIYENVKDLKNGELSKPILADGIVIIIKKYDEKNNENNLEAIKKNIVHQEKMKKLDMFSNSHYSGLERKVKIKFL